MDKIMLRTNPNQMPPVVDFDHSLYFKRYGRYFDARASYTRKADTIIYFAWATPTGKWSRSKWATLRFNSERNPKNMMERIKKEFTDLIAKNKSDVDKGYRIAEIVHYSGELL